jgi:DNA-binding transcriptional regulator GbsR (MarR family)
VRWAASWGINRTVGQIYALLYVSPQALNADEIAEALAFSRSNVSMGLKELQAWRLGAFAPPSRATGVSTSRRLRTSGKSFALLAEERRRREIEPTLSMLRSALLEQPQHRRRATCPGNACAKCTT